MERVEIKISGIVQGISYRAFISIEARKLGIVGTVQNLDDGSVKVIAEADRNTLILFMDSIKNGYRYARIDNVESKFAKAGGVFDKFQIIY